MHHPRFSPKTPQHLGPKALNILALLSVLVLAACNAAPPLETPLPYAFTIGGFTDARTEEQQLDAEAQPFPPNVMRLQELLITQLPATRWGARPATLHVELQHFESSELGTDRALSIAAGLHAFDSAGYDLGEVQATCSVTGFGDSNDPETAVKAVQQNGLAALHPTARNARQWDTLTTQCMTDLVRQLRNRLLQPPKLAH